MVILILKSEYIIGFEMANWEKEKALVDRFNSGTLKPDSVLDLKKKGTYKVSDIKSMEFAKMKILKKEEPKKDDGFNEFKKAVENSKRENEDRRLKEFYKAFTEALKDKK